MGLSKKQLEIMESLPLNEDGGEVTETILEQCYFCPKCGSKKMYSTENMASYPEMWVKTFCSKCNFLLCLIDNSPPMVWAEYKYNDYVIDF